MVVVVDEDLEGACGGPFCAFGECIDCECPTYGACGPGCPGCGAGVPIDVYGAGCPGCIYGAGVPVDVYGACGAEIAATASIIFRACSSVQPSSSFKSCFDRPNKSFPSTPFLAKMCFRFGSDNRSRNDWTSLTLHEATGGWPVVMVPSFVS